MNNMKTVMMSSPLGVLEIHIGDDGVSELNYTNSSQAKDFTTDAKSEVVTQLNEYFSGKRRKFDVPLHIEGTPFQKKVWQTMLEIPYGEVMSYKEVAETIGKPRAFRAVANACGANLLPILIPCHRVVASNGLGGYSSGVDKKIALLKLEGYLKS